MPATSEADGTTQTNSMCHVRVHSAHRGECNEERRGHPECAFHAEHVPRKPGNMSEDLDLDNEGGGGEGRGWTE